MTWLPRCPNIPVGNLVNPPPKWLDLIERRPDFACAFPDIATMTMAKFSRMSQVQVGVNRRVRYRRDLTDRWEPADTEGDCEDYALAKALRLRGYGWPCGALRLALCFVTLTRPARLQAHAVLMVETDHGTWVLDNRMRYPRRWTRMIGYRWLWREKPGSGKWEKLMP